jgi:hypothetical protein
MILQPEELGALRKIARKEGVSVGAVIRRAIDTVINRLHPERRKRMVGLEAEAFLDRLADRLPASILTGAKRKAFKNRLVK